MRCGFLLFDNLTQLDLSGPYEVFPRAPGAEALLVARSVEPVTAQWGMRILPDVDFDGCPPLDLLLVPGGFGVNEAILDAPTITFVRRAAAQSKHVVSVCTGALILGAAGLLDGRRAATHWAFQELLPLFGANPTDERVVRDGDVFTGGGVTAGIDVALTVLAEVFGPEIAQRVQLQVEYAPNPPFACGTPRLAALEVLQATQAGVASRVEETRRCIEQAAGRRS